MVASQWHSGFVNGRLGRLHTAARQRPARRAFTYACHWAQWRTSAWHFAVRYARFAQGLALRCEAPAKLAAGVHGLQIQVTPRDRCRLPAYLHFDVWGGGAAMLLECRRGSVAFWLHERVSRVLCALCLRRTFPDSPEGQRG